MKQQTALAEAYYKWIAENKIDLAPLSGFRPDPDTYHPSLKPHQRDMVTWAARRGVGLIAASFGLGKTRIEIELLRQVIARHPGQQVLVICPLGVKTQFSDEDGPEMDIAFRYVTDDASALASDTPYLITNYERVRDGNITPAYLAQNIAAVCLDEGNVLRSLGSKTQQTFLDVLAPIKYRWVATATPSPNNYKELIYYAQFFGLADIGAALTKFFKRDVSKAGNLKLMPSQEENFWRWVASWALFVEHPRDLGYDEDGYDLTDLHVHWHQVASDHKAAWNDTDSFGQHFLIRNSANGVTQASREKRTSMSSRIAKAAEIISDGEPADHWIVWHHLEDERRMINDMIPEAVEVYGTQDLDERERRILGFTRGRFRILSTKPEIAGSGCNFQRHCHKAVYVGINYKFDDFFQSIHRLLRYLQKHDVEIHIIFTDAESDVVQALKRKWQQHEKLIEKMKAIIAEYGLTTEAIRQDLQRSIGVQRYEERATLFTLVNNDTVLEMERLADASVDLIHTSIPFGNHYEYSLTREDFGHNDTDNQFWSQMDFLTPNLYRVLKPGRIAAIHVKDRLLYGHQTPHGMMEVSPFSDECIAHFRQHGFIFFGRITIATDVVRENASTYRLGESENAKDSSKMGVGMPEYLLLFRKPQTDRSRSYADEPVTKDKSVYTRAQWQIDAHAFWRSSGNRLLRPDEVRNLNPEDLPGMETGNIYRWYQEFSRQTVYDYDAHVALGQPLLTEGRLPAQFMLFAPQAPEHIANGPASGVWTDIVFMRTLNAQQSQGRRENHVCPLPLDIVDRIITRYSNPGELVLDPFAGIGTVPYRAILLDRIGFGVELNPEYYAAAVRYCQEAEVDKLAPTLFDLDMYKINTNGHTEPVTAVEAFA